MAEETLSLACTRDSCRKVGRCEDRQPAQGLCDGGMMLSFAVTREARAAWRRRYTASQIDGRAVRRTSDASPPRGLGDIGLGLVKVTVARCAFSDAENSPPHVRADRAFIWTCGS